MVRKPIVKFIVLLFIMLWIYAAVSKLLDYNTSRLQMSQSPFITEFAGILVWIVPMAEVIISGLLIPNRTRIIGLYASLFLMTMFSAYIYVMLNMSYHVPCSCGGILNNLGWEQHLVFNISFVLLAIIAIALHQSILKKILAISLTMLLATGLVLIPAICTIRSGNKDNGFNRSFFKEELKLIAAWEKPENVTEIEGFIQNKIVFKTKIPGIIWMFTMNDPAGSYYATIPFPANERASWSYQYLPEDSSIVIAAGNVPGLYFKKNSEYKFGKLPFTRIVRISPSSFIARGFDSSIKNRDQIFIKENILSGKRIINTAIFPLMNDAGLSTDGTLHFDKSTGWLSYITFYSNNLVVLDTNLNVIYHTSTIDSTRHNRTRIGELRIDDKVKYTNTGPRETVNTDNCVSEGILYNRSLVKADNEERKTFSQNGVIDLYDLRNGRYMGSVYLPYHANEPPLGFKVTDQFMFVLYNSKLIKYKLTRGI